MITMMMMMMTMMVVHGHILQAVSCAFCDADIGTSWELYERMMIMTAQFRTVGVVHGQTATWKVPKGEPRFLNGGLWRADCKLWMK
jgi:hypothetical protein